MTGETKGRIASGVNVLAGVWLFLAPFVLAYQEIQQALWNDMVVGALIFILALGRVAAPKRFQLLSWVNFVLGTWLVVAPFVLVYGALDGLVDPGAAIGNDIVMGIIVLAMAAWSATATRQMPSERVAPRRTYVNSAERS